MPEPTNHKPMMDIARPAQASRPEVAAVQTSKPKRHPNLLRIKKAAKSKALLIIAVLLLAGLPSLYFYNKSRQAEARLNDPNTANQEVVNEVVKKVGALILLPSGEQPTLATVSDVSKVKGQAFFQNAANGDKVLVYTQARKAILYRPSKNLIIEVAPLNVNSPTTTN